MRVNVNELQTNVNSISKLFDDFDGDYVNMCNLYKQLSNIWNDADSKKFIAKSDGFKIKFEIMSNEIRDIYKVYKYLLNEYSKIGKKIEIDLNSIENVFADIDNLINESDDLLKKFNSINFYKYNFEQNKLDSIKKNLSYINKKLYSIKKNVEDKYNTILNIEDTSRTMINKIDINYIEGVSSYVG